MQKTYNTKSILMLVDFYEPNFDELEKVKKHEYRRITIPADEILGMWPWQNADG